MLYNIYSKIIITNQVDLELENYSSVLINQDIEDLTASCTISIPNKNVTLGKNESGKQMLLQLSINDTTASQINIVIGNKISVFFDYYANKIQLNEIKNNTTYEKKNFMGYISRFEYNEDTINIVCEDANWLFKHTRLKNSWGFDIEQDTKNLNNPEISAVKTRPNLKEIIEYIIFNTDSVALDTSFINTSRIQDIELGKFRISDPSTGAEIFNMLKDDYKLYIYFTSEWDDSFKKMITYINAGLKYSLNKADITSKAIYSYTYVNTKYPVISQNITFNTFDKAKELAVIGVSKQSNSDESITIGTGDGIKVISKPITKKNKDKTTTPTLAEKQADAALDKIEDKPTRIELNIPDLYIIEDGKYSDATTKYKGTLVDYVLNTWNNFPESGFEGSFETFLKPQIYVGETIDFWYYNGLNFVGEQHYVDGVTISLNASTGLAQEIKLGNKIADL